MAIEELINLVGQRIRDEVLLGDLSNQVKGIIESHEHTTFVINSDEGFYIDIDKESWRIVAVKVVAESEEYKPYRHPLPMGLRWGMKRDDVRSILGLPKLSSDGTKILSITLAPSDNYDWNGIELCVVYGGEDGGVSELGFQIRNIAEWRQQQEDSKDRRMP